MAENVFRELKSIFHEPSRLSIVSFLSGAGQEGLSFTDLRDRTALTEGNLSRHLKMLENEGFIQQEKEFVDNRPRTTVFLTAVGQKEFNAYLQNLENALIAAFAGGEAKENPHRHGNLPLPSRS